MEDKDSNDLPNNNKSRDTLDSDDKNKSSHDSDDSSTSNERNDTFQSERLKAARLREERKRQEEASRMLREITSDPDMMDHVIRAAVNPEVAKELARQADTAWRNIETLPGGFRALCQMHHNLQQPLWQAAINSNAPYEIQKQPDNNSLYPNENKSLKAEPLPNPWKPEHKQQQLPTREVRQVNPFFNSFQQPQPPTSQAQVVHRSNAINTTDSSQRYASEMAQLAEMGILDSNKCLTALEATDGDLFQAIDILQDLQDLDTENEDN
ncbi:bifunctional Ubiquitin-associated domain/UBA-like superfamily [Babesia duncani]|uniref:Bifunctional Ubiquitin-associated domain/UBA-like superfamily n=1 Tax=Babesia duncani TaxID=323732 RepID=A0AAD9PL00_9APIC|nr:bifunctional Ubiquitin-associated domain/UBA-like superfamily [Babesia duncani]